MEFGMVASGLNGVPVPIGAAGFDAAEHDDGIFVRLRRRKFSFILVFVGVLAVVFGYYSTLTPTYKAETTVVISVPDQLLNPDQSSGAQVQSVGDTADLESQSAIISSPMLIHKVLQQPGMRAILMRECELREPSQFKLMIRRWMQRPPGPSCTAQLDDSDGMTDGLRSLVSVSSTGRSRVLAISYTSPSPEAAKAVTDGLVQAYLDQQLQQKLQPRENAIQWLKEEISRVTDRLKTSQEQIASFLHREGVVKGQAAPIASEQLTSLGQQLTIAQAAQSEAAARMQQSEIRNNSTSALLGNRTVGDVKQQLTAVTAQIAQLSARYGSANPALREAMQQRQTLQQMLAQETTNVNRSAVADYKIASDHLKAIQQQMDELKGEVRGNDDATTQVAALERQVETDGLLYVDLTKNLNQLQTGMRLITPNAQLVSWAQLPRVVFYPKRSIFILTASLLAFGAAMATALLFDRSDRTIRTRAGVESAANLRVLGSIPYLPRAGRNAPHLVAQIRRASPFQESIRALYAECLLVNGFSNGDEGATKLRSFLVTSSESGEGKSFTAMSFAYFAAATGQRVLLMECDLRRPSIGRSLSLPPKPGVSELLRGWAAPAEAIHRPNATGPDIITSGETAMESAELLAGAGMKQLLAWAAEKYDIVVIDTPPSGILPDARILAPCVDGVLFCAQWGRSLTKSVAQGAREIASVGGRVLGIVLEGAQETPYKLYGTTGS